jgi:hypothetical protein
LILIKSPQEIQRQSDWPVGEVEQPKFAALRSTRYLGGGSSFGSAVGIEVTPIKILRIGWKPKRVSGPSGHLGAIASVATQRQRWSEYLSEADYYQNRNRRIRQAVK